MCCSLPAGGPESDDFEYEDPRALRGHVNYSSGPSMPGSQNANYHPQTHYQQHGRSYPGGQAYSGLEADMDGAGQQDWGDACYEDEGDEQDGWNTGTGAQGPDHVCETGGMRGKSGLRTPVPLRVQPPPAASYSSLPHALPACQSPHLPQHAHKSSALLLLSVLALLS
jgi:hypothetical protein